MNAIYHAASVTVQKIPTQVAIGDQMVNAAVECTVVQLTPTENITENSVIKLVIPGADAGFEQGKQYTATFTEVE
jgi:hypothetical protein